MPRSCNRPPRRAAPPPSRRRRLHVRLHHCGPPAIDTCLAA
ncbi:hypothetical protein [Sphaerotilus hippei]|nr:hypothetical protein [Sphaerotilus hippei]